MIVAFPRSPGRAHLELLAGLAPAHDRRGPARDGPEQRALGHIMVLLGHGRHTSSYGPIYVYRHALHPPAPALPPFNAGAAGGTAFSGQGMWIWYVSDSNGGSIASIVAQAHAAQVSTVFVKSSDGATQLLEPVLPPARGRNCTPTA